MGFHSCFQNAITGLANKGMELTASSVRSCLAPASGSSSYLALGVLRDPLRAIMFKSEIRDSTINALLEKAANRNYGRYLLKLVLKHVRGFSGEPVVFDFPVTALIGPNGGGKTTVMGAAGCAYKSVAPKQFFAKSGKYDETMQDWGIEYELIDRDVNKKDAVRRTASFRNQRWNRDALKRDVLVFGVSHTVPANERGDLLKCASSTFTVSDDQIEEFSASVRDAVSRILGKDVTGFKRLRLEPSGRIVLLTAKRRRAKVTQNFTSVQGNRALSAWYLRLSLRKNMLSS
jgi:AAA domain